MYIHTVQSFYKTTVNVAQAYQISLEVRYIHTVQSFYKTTDQSKCCSSIPNKPRGKIYTYSTVIL